MLKLVTLSGRLMTVVFLSLGARDDVCEKKNVGRSKGDTLRWKEEVWVAIS